MEDPQREERRLDGHRRRRGRHGMDCPASEGGSMAESRAGSNGWTCMPDVPTSPGADPVCLDANALQ
jgi:hypothetical protein